MERRDADAATTYVSTLTPLRYSCGLEDCAFLRHNCTILDGVEKDVYTAARMGKALLARHEAYMASAEHDRHALTTRIEELERDGAELGAQNKTKSAENDGLLKELDSLNAHIEDRNTNIKMLKATLLGSQAEITRLEAAATRAADMERELTGYINVLEEKRLHLEEAMMQTRQEKDDTVKRCRRAQLGILDLQAQLHRMEQEAQEEREGHAEVVGTMRRRRAAEKDLETAAGWLKGAAAVKTLGSSSTSSNAVSHFVRNLLQDNASLQLGIAELRDMLAASNDEMQVLREQLLHHHPMADAESNASTTRTLRAEIERPEPAPLPKSQQLHIHHHYHITSKVEAKKPRRRRLGLSGAGFSPPHSPHPPTPPSGPRQPPTFRAPASHAHKLSTSTASGVSNPRWSVFSEVASDFSPSTVPSSPPSDSREMTHDCLCTALSPVSPTNSGDPASPSGHMSHRNRPCIVNTKTSNRYPAREQPDSLIQYVYEAHGERNYTTENCLAVPSTNESCLESLGSEAATDQEGTQSRCLDGCFGQSRHGLCRMLSHGSLFSLSHGLDTVTSTVKARPSQLALRPLGLSAAGTNFSSVTARPTMARTLADGKRGSLVLRDHLADAVAGSLHVPKSRNRNSSSGSHRNRLASWRLFGANLARPQPSQHASGSRATTPISAVAPSITDLSTPTPALPTTSSILAHGTSPSLNMSVSFSLMTVTHGIFSMGSGLSMACAASSALLKPSHASRASGINQPGAIPGFGELMVRQRRRGAPSKVVPDPGSVDREALREVLEG